MLTFAPAKEHCEAPQHVIRLFFLWVVALDGVVTSYVRRIVGPTHMPEAGYADDD
jgi:hypothetical protein